MELSEMLARLRKKNGLMQATVADYLVEHTRKAANKKTISQWECGRAQPSIQQFLSLCDLYGVDDIRFTFSGVKSPQLKRLNLLGKERVEEYIAMLARDPQFLELGEVQRPKLLKLFDLPVSAGTGSFLDSDAYEEIEVDESVPENADYAVRISGDSMTPRYIDHQIVFVRQQEKIELGEIGIFVLNDDAYCKKQGRDQLISLNDKYDPITVHDYDSFSVLGKVIG
ncbi:putative repressor protein - phage associated [Clostridia bacterium]|nr:putative repressor protein - phage associated [Clostridia bacterium]